ncbi:MAG: hypothetical protein L0206_04400 [Actinobacteria bacterium]|nr:hypothetical protein [Actinomycetota bacterium]
MHLHRRSASAALLTAVLAASCTSGDGPDGNGDGTTPPTQPPPVTAVTGPVTSVSPTPPALPDEPPPTRGVVDVDCVNGWKTPVEGSARFAQPLEVIRRQAGVEGGLEVVDMRFFTGPESPPSDKGYLAEVERWYVKAFAPEDLSFQGRFLVESRGFGDGLVAVAAYDSNGFRSPDWVGFQFDSADTEPRSYEGLPGEWAGIPYDFVAGGGGLEIPGLPDEVTGCLDAT